MEYITIVLCVIIIALLFESSGILRGRIEQLQKQNADEFERGRRESGAFQKELREETLKRLDGMESKLLATVRENAAHQQRLMETLGAIQKNNVAQNERQTAKIAEAIAGMQESNEKRLEQMRLTVDEKLNSTLTTRLDSSFKTVSEQLENLYKSLGEMKELSNGVTTNVTSLSRILTNVKARGTWAEVQLEGILDQTIPGMYERNFAPREGSREQVEFAVRIPTGEGGITYLPIDSKFPMETYVRLCDAADAANAEETERARKALEDRILSEARTVQKYISIPRTTPYAIMYLATEGLYAEVISSRTGLSERIHSECGIMLAGPATITALLNSLSMGFRAVAINEKANEVRQLLAITKAQHDKFGAVLDKVRKKLDEAGQTLTEAQSRNRIIQKKLKDIEEIDSSQAEALMAKEANTGGESWIM